jgi:hypothetical protein
MALATSAPANTQHAQRCLVCLYLHGLDELLLLVGAALGVSHLALDLEVVRDMGLEGINAAAAIVRLALFVTILVVLDGGVARNSMLGAHFRMHRAVYVADENR